ncbi:MAG: hypothetical protein WBN89_06720 [Prochlorococcaceae cyanobacterium]
MQIRAVQTVGTGNEADDQAVGLSEPERELLEQADGRVLLLQLHGALIHAVAALASADAPELIPQAG